MENNKLKVKDLVNIGIFSALYMVISMIVMIPVGIAPILWLIWPVLRGFSAEHFYTFDDQGSEARRSIDSCNYYWAFVFCNR